LAVVILPAVVAADTQDGKWSKLDGSYMLYGGSLDEMTPPSASDTKLSVFVKGQLAKDLFTRMGRADRKQCAGDITTRTRGALSCTKTIKTGEVECSFGFDVLQGKAIAGSVC
jgi:hypothetical protein